MSDDTQTLKLKERIKKLAEEIESDVKKYLWNARLNYYISQGLSWASLISSAAAALLGLIPSGVEKWVIGMLAALSAALVGINQKQGFQQKANWHYRKVDRLKALRRHLSFEIPVSPSLEDIAAISHALSETDSGMSKEWEDMEHEPKKPV